MPSMPRMIGSTISIALDISCWSAAGSVLSKVAMRAIISPPSVDASTLRPQRAERKGEPELLRRRDRVLPRGPRLAREHVAGARLKEHLPHPPRLGFAALEPQPCRASERDADDGSERGRVAMPADRRPGRVALDEDLDELLGLVARQLGRPCPYRQHPVRRRLAGLRRSGFVVVVEA